MTPAQPVTVVLSRPLLDRIGAAATAEFESCESFIPALIDLGLRLRRAMNYSSIPHAAPASRKRDGGKDPANTLLRPVNLASKRGRMLHYFLETVGATVHSAAAEFGLSRSGVFMHWTELNQVHGIGYAFDAASDAITVRLPCEESDVFEVA